MEKEFMNSLLLYRLQLGHWVLNYNKNVSERYSLSLSLSLSLSYED